jgi:hypothetical protein
LTQPAFYTVLTTIQPPTPAVERLARAVRTLNGKMLVVGDRKGPDQYPVAGAELLSLARQVKLPLRLPKALPLNHYTRKNLGYLVAISRGAQVIYETDDDNRPPARWQRREPQTSARAVTRPGWCNVYRFFTRELIWPRGLPLEEINQPGGVARAGRLRSVRSLIQQDLVSGSPDVDAIWRLALDHPVRFSSAASVTLLRGVWCPFNSQSTWWWPETYPLMYLPSFCSFRMTDIWRSFIAQRCLWELGGTVTFHASGVVQDRNAHNLLRDFKDEVPGYLSNSAICRKLMELPLQRGAGTASANLRQCYQALVEEKVFPRKELRLVKAWLRDLEGIQAGQSCPL